MLEGGSSSGSEADLILGGVDGGIERGPPADEQQTAGDALCLCSDSDETTLDGWRPGWDSGPWFAFIKDRDWGSVLGSSLGPLFRFLLGSLWGSLLRIFVGISIRIFVGIPVVIFVGALLGFLLRALLGSSLGSLLGYFALGSLLGGTPPQGLGLEC